MDFVLRKHPCVVRSTPAYFFRGGTDRLLLLSFKSVVLCLEHCREEGVRLARFGMGGSLICSIELLLDERLVQKALVVTTSLRVARA